MINIYTVYHPRWPYSLRIMTIDEYAQFMWLRGYMYYEMYPLNDVPIKIQNHFFTLASNIIRGTQSLPIINVPFKQVQERLPEWLHPYFVHFVLREPPESKW